MTDQQSPRISLIPAEMYHALTVAHAEIARLRLTDDEREAVEAAARIVDEYEEEMDGFPSGAAATLHKMLERLHK